jgi:hypothetical protein
MKIQVSFPMLLGLLFIGLKLTNSIDWSWWYVTMPLWLVPCVCLSVAAVMFAIAGFLRVIEGILK